MNRILLFSRTSALVIFLHPFFIGASANAQTYCPISGLNTSYEYIQSVAVGDEENISGQNNGYADYSSEVLAALPRGDTISLSLKPGFSDSAYTEKWRVFIDYNQNGSFDDPGEMAFDGTSSGTNALNENITVSSNALVGETRLRVAMRYNSMPDACGNYTWGEVEDYTVEITEGAPNPNPVYCTASGNNTSYEYIQSVEVNNAINESGDSGGYSEFTSETLTMLEQGETINLSLLPGFSSGSYAEEWKVFIDYNQNGSFDDPGETVFEGITLGTAPLTGPFDVPADAPVGETRMRVAMQWNSSPNACGNFDYGEVEDYVVEIASPLNYCAASSDHSSWEWIGGVELAEFSNIQAEDSYQGYEDFTDQKIEVEKGLEYSLNLVPGELGNVNYSYWAAWIDYNRDGDFSDEGENVARSNGMVNTSVTTSIVIPLSAITGNTRLRVTRGGTHSTSSMTACHSPSWGQVEDYTVSISGQTSDEVCWSGLDVLADATAYLDSDEPPFLDTEDTSLDIKEYATYGYNRRAVLEFDLSSIPSNATVTAVQLDLFVNGFSSGNGSYPLMTLHAYSGNGIAELSDAEVVPNEVGVSELVTATGELSISLDPQVTQQAIAGSGFLGLLGRNQTSTNSLRVASSETLVAGSYTGPKLTICFIESE